jgi:hypothetical protein
MRNRIYNIKETKVFQQLSHSTVIRISKLIYTPRVLIATALYWMIAKQKTICPLHLVINVTITDTNKIFSADKVITNFQRISRQSTTLINTKMFARCTYLYNQLHIGSTLNFIILANMT